MESQACNNNDTRMRRLITIAEFKRYIYGENDGLHYTLVVDGYIPDLKLPEDESRMNDLPSCEFNIDAGCVELRYADGNRIFIDCAAVENEVVNNMYHQFELDWLIYNVSLDAKLILNGDPDKYLKAVIIYRPFES